MKSQMHDYISRTLGYVLAGRLRSPKSNVGESFVNADGSRFVVFKETVLDPAVESKTEPEAMFRVQVLREADQAVAGPGGNSAQGPDLRGCARLQVEALDGRRGEQHVSGSVRVGHSGGRGGLRPFGLHGLHDRGSRPRRHILRGASQSAHRKERLHDGDRRWVRRESDSEDPPCLH